LLEISHKAKINGLMGEYMALVLYRVGIDGITAWHGMAWGDMTFPIENGWNGVF
jgi:hypothetical protein